jgi:hypothetical protein
MDQILETIQMFVDYANIRLNPKNAKNFIGENKKARILK